MPIYNTPQRPSKRSDGWPRRHDIQLDTDPERLCRILVGLVESMGASTALTNAVVALDKARNFIADHVERIEESVPTSPQTIIEIGGQSMTQAQFDAARFPLLHPNPGPVSPADEMSVSFPSTSPEQDEQQQQQRCKHGDTEPHYMRFTTGTTAHCPGPVSLEQQEAINGPDPDGPTFADEWGDQ